jgi:hypothetical protein
MINDYTLLHSTVPGYVRNRAWRSLLYPAGTGTGTKSRAEEYIENR